MEIPKVIKDEIWEYCRINNITNVDEFTIKMIKQGFTVEKYGATPAQKETIIEKIVEKIVEIPVEKIVEVPIKIFDTELSENMKIIIQAKEDAESKILEMIKINDDLIKQIEKLKNKKDIYGEE